MPGAAPVRSWKLLQGELQFTGWTVSRPCGAFAFARRLCAGFAQAAGW
jgi:hypothetical protein